MNRPLPLANKRILITRSKEQASNFSRFVQDLGGTAVEVPLIQFQPPQDQQKRSREIKESLSDFEWLVFTSVNGVKYFFDLYNGPISNKIAAVGKRTRAALLELGLEVSLMPEKFSAEDLLDSFAQLEATSAIVVQGNLARPLLRDELKDLGYNVKQIVVYENTPHILTEQEQRAVKELRVDLYTFTSPSTVHNFLKLFGAPIGPVAAIGPITKQALEAEGISVDICPDEYTIPGLVQEMVKYFHREEK
ncbi:uroporphyrinogen-III synthase [Bacillus sp. THAF10]|uniref:uroporphyrinogen-III synthase n=1 Tax=Bacillus sp. THAF10 TaxID=2587848 RepID=UPI001267B8B9|nr:uroporphyrinogen-III synthase [Bacillus sp. THAF10]QFT90082.1 uroporphyrinogen-III synthase [Bacillus sp. THAF10]